MVECQGIWEWTTEESGGRWQRMGKGRERLAGKFIQRRCGPANGRLAEISLARKEKQRNDTA